MQIKKFYIAIIIISFFTPFLASANFPNVEIRDGDKCLHLTTVDTGGGVYEYVTAPSGFGDDDQPNPAWSINGGSCTTGHDHDVGSQPDGSYTFTGASSGVETFYIVNGIWSLTSGSSTPATIEATSSIDQTQQNIGVAIFIFLATIVVITVLLSTI